MPPLLFGLGAIVGWVVGFLITAGSAVVSALAVIWPFLAQMWSAIFSVFRRVGKLFAKLGGHIYEFASAVWTKVLRPIAEILHDWWNRFIGFLRDVIDPIIERIEWLADLIDEFYDAFIAPVFEWFDRARQILGGLSMLGVGWAGTLVNVLNQVEGGVNWAFDEVQSYLYDITTVLNDLLSPFGWIKWEIFGKTVYQWNGGIASILVGIGIPASLEERRRRHADEAEPPYLPMVQDEWTELIIHGHPAVQRSVAYFKEGRFRSEERIPWP